MLETSELRADIAYLDFEVKLCKTKHPAAGVIPLRKFVRKGQTITEYFFAVSLITLATILALTIFGEGVGNRYSNILNGLPFP